MRAPCQLADHWQAHAGCVLFQKCQRLEGSNSNLRAEIKRLARESRELRELLVSHCQVCPKVKVARWERPPPPRDQRPPDRPPTTVNVRCTLSDREGTTLPRRRDAYPTSVSRHLVTELCELTCLNSWTRYTESQSLCCAVKSLERGWL